MDFEDRLRFLLGTLRPMAEHTLPYLTSILGVADRSRGVHIGSGLRCTLGGRRAIVTAAHVIREASTYPNFAVSVGYGAPPFVAYGEVHCNWATDLALYFVPDDFPEARPDVAFFPEDRIDPSGRRLSTDYLFVHGFPGVRSLSSAIFQGVVSKSLPYGAMQRIEGLPADLEPFQFAINFDPRDVHSERREDQGQIPDPRGLSGSPVFRIGVSGRAAKDWDPEWSQLVGIVTQWKPDAELLVAVNVSEVMALAGRESPSDIMTVQNP